MFATLLYVLAALTLYLILPLSELSLDKQPQHTAFNHVNVVDVNSGEVLRDMSILVEGNTIKAVTPSQSATIPDGYKKIDARGKYVIPGLWDMHTHSIKVSPQIHHPLYIAHGVTSVRDLSGCMDQDDSFWACIEDRQLWSAQALSGKRVSPRYALQSSYQVDGGDEVPSGFAEFFKLNNLEDARQLVAFYQNKGADFIKIHAGVSLEQYDYLTQALQNSPLSLVGHKPLKVSLQHAIRAGQKSLEHGRIFLFACSPLGETLSQQSDPYQFYTPEFQRQLLQTQDPSPCQQIMAQMADSNSWWVPTLTTLKSSAYAKELMGFTEEKFEYVPTLMKSLFWQNDLKNVLNKGLDQQQQFVHKDFYHQAQHYLPQAQQRGVKILVGTDTLDTAVVAGQSLHDEMLSMVEAGMSPFEVLRAATISAAEFANQADKYGSVEAGKVADLVWLNANPLQDIRHTQQIDAVMFNGIYYQHRDIKTMKTYAKEQAQSIRLNTHYLSSVIASPLMRQQIAD